MNRTRPCFRLGCFSWLPVHIGDGNHGIPRVPMGPPLLFPIWTPIALSRLEGVTGMGSARPVGLASRRNRPDKPTWTHEEGTFRLESIRYGLVAVPTRGWLMWLASKLPQPRTMVIYVNIQLRGSVLHPLTTQISGLPSDRCSQRHPPSGFRRSGPNHHSLFFSNHCKY